MFSDVVVRALRPLRFRGKVRLLDPLVPRCGVRTARVFGVRVDLDLAEYIQRMMYLGCFEREETRLLLRYLRPGMRVVDVGANVGYFSFLSAARVGPSGRVLAVEPSPQAHAALRRAVDDNRLSQVRVVNAALGRSPGATGLFVPPAALGNHAPSMIPTDGWEAVRVPVVRLDDLLTEHNLPQVDLLKIDVEGYELEVLAGAETAFRAGRVRAVLCEFNDNLLRKAGASADRLWDWLAGHGLRSAAYPARPAFPPHSFLNLFLCRAE
jgi:FkbM family methyltransferase